MRFRKTDQPEGGFAGYRFHRVLGPRTDSGVYEATEQATGRAVVIETLVGESAESEDLREWFAWAWEAVGELDQAGVVDVYDVGERDGVPFAVREFIEGEDLASRLESDGPLTPETADAIFYRLTAALSVLHEAGVVHGSLVPSSVLLGPGEDGDEADAYLSAFGRAEGLRGDDVAGLAGIHAATLGPKEAALSPIAEVFERAGAGRYRTADDLAADVTRARTGEALAEDGDDGEDDEDGDEVATSSVGRGGKALALIAMVAVAAVAVIFLTTDDDPEPTDTASAPATSTPEEEPPPPGPGVSATGVGGPPSTPLGEPIEVGGSPTALSVRDGVVYVATADSGELIGYDELSGKEVVGPVDLGGPAAEVTIVDEVAWVTLPASNEVARVDLGSKDPAAETVAVGEQPAGLTAALGAVFVANEGSGQLSRIETSDSSVVSVPLAAQEPRGIAFGNDELWVTDGAGRLLEVDPENTAGSQSFEVGAEPRGVLVVDDSVWVANSGDGTVTRFDFETDEGELIDVGGEPLDVAADGERIYVSNADGYVSAIDLATNEVERIEVPSDVGAPVGIAVGSSGVWVTTGEGDSLLALETSS